MIESLVVDGLRVRVGRVGAGPVIVYLHSGSGELGDIPFTRELANRGFSVIGPEYPGFGQSEIDPSIKTIDDAVYRTRRVLEALDVRSAVAICGSSIGGWLGVEMLVWNPSLADSLVLIDAPGLYIDGSPIMDIFFEPPDVLQAAANPHQVNYMDALLPALDGDSGEIALVSHFIKTQAAIGRVGWSPYLHDPRLPSRLASVRARTLVVWGEDDGLVPAAHGHYYADHIPDAEFVEIPMTGHAPAMEKPAEVAELVAKFVLASSALASSSATATSA